MMISIWIYAALVTERQIPKGMSSHDAQVSFACRYSNGNKIINVMLPMNIL